MKLQRHSVVLAFIVAVSFAAHVISSEPSAIDQSFVKKAAIGGMLEVKLGEVTQKNAEAPKVKEFGAMMIVEHGK